MKSEQGELLCNAWLPAGRRPQSRSFPVRQSGDSASKIPGLDEPTYHKPPGRHGDGTCLKLLQLFLRFWSKMRPVLNPVGALRIKFFCELALSRPLYQEVPGRQ